MILGLAELFGHRRSEECVGIVAVFEGAEPDKWTEVESTECP